MTVQQRDSLTVITANGARAFILIFTGLKGITLGTRDAVMAPVPMLSFGCHRHRHCELEEVVYGVEHRPSACCAHDIDTVDLKR